MTSKFAKINGNRINHAVSTIRVLSYAYTELIFSMQVKLKVLHVGTYMLSHVMIQSNATIKMIHHVNVNIVISWPA